MNQKGLIVIVLTIITLIGGGYYYNKSQRSSQQSEVPRSSPLISEEESLRIAKQAVAEDLKILANDNCLVFRANNEGDFIAYTVTRKFDKGCLGDPTSTPAIPQIKIDLSTKEVFVQSLDGEFRPLLPSRAVSDTTIQNEITQWKTYQNDKYGITLKYPSAWYATEPKSNNFQGDAICFGPTKERGDSPEFCVTSVWSRSIPDCINNLKNCASNRDAIAEERIKNKTAEERFLTINNYPAYYYKVTNPPNSYTEIEYVLRSQNKIDTVSFRSVGADGTSYESYLPSFDTFLKSIQF